MRVSKLIAKYLPEINYVSVNECEVDSLGLLVSQTDIFLCSYIDNISYLDTISSNIRMVLVSDELKDAILDKGLGVIVVENPRQVFFKLHNALESETNYNRRNFISQIADSAVISDMAYISPNNVKIGENVIIEPFAMIYENSYIGDNCIIRAGACIGGSGYEEKREGKTIFSVKHMGGILIHSFVEIQNNTCIDRAIYPWDNTVIGDYTKIDNLVHIGHAAKVGNACMIVAQVGIGGRTEIGNQVWVGFGATLRNGLIIGDNARINMGSVVTQDVLPKAVVTGNFAIPHDIFMDNLKKSIKRSDENGI